MKEMLWKRKMQSLTARLRKGEKGMDRSGAPMKHGIKKAAKRLA